jgi:hypothetical protein
MCSVKQTLKKFLRDIKSAFSLFDLKELLFIRFMSLCRRTEILPESGLTQLPYGHDLFFTITPANFQ